MTTRSMTPSNITATITRSINNMTNRLNQELRELDITSENGMYALTTTVQSSINAPARFFNAWNHINDKERELWRQAILKELKDMNNRSIFKIIPIKHLPKFRTLVGNKWV